MRVLVCGGRNYSNKKFLWSVLDEFHLEVHTITVLIEGEAPGADTLAREWARSRGVDHLPFPAQWEMFGRAAGPIRNAQMIQEGRPDWGIAFYDGTPATSKGTADMVKKLKKANIGVDEYEGTKKL